MTTLSFSVPRFGSGRGSVFPPGSQPLHEQTLDRRSYHNFHSKRSTSVTPETFKKNASPVRQDQSELTLDTLHLNPDRPKGPETHAGDNDRDDNIFVNSEDKAALGRATDPKDPSKELTEAEKRRKLYEKQTGKKIRTEWWQK